MQTDWTAKLDQNPEAPWIMSSASMDMLKKRLSVMPKQPVQSQGKPIPPSNQHNQPSIEPTPFQRKPTVKKEWTNNPGNQTMPASIGGKNLKSPPVRSRTNVDILGTEEKVQDDSVFKGTSRPQTVKIDELKKKFQHEPLPMTQRKMQNSLSPKPHRPPGHSPPPKKASARSMKSVPTKPLVFSNELAKQVQLRKVHTDP